jgi:hypothetical protein
MTGSHEVRGSIPLGSTNNRNKPITDGTLKRVLAVAMDHPS